MAASSKLSAGSLIKVVAAVVALVGLGVMLFCNSKGSDYAFTGFGTLALGVVVGAALALVSAFAPSFAGDKAPVVGTVGDALAVVALTYTAINAVGTRVLLISGLFSWNSMNTVGWETFRLTVAAAVCLLVAALAVVVSAYFGAGKTQNA